MRSNVILQRKTTNSRIKFGLRSHLPAAVDFIFASTVLHFTSTLFSARDAARGCGFLSGTGFAHVERFCAAADKWTGRRWGRRRRRRRRVRQRRRKRVDSGSVNDR